MAVSLIPSSFPIDHFKSILENINKPSKSIELYSKNLMLQIFPIGSFLKSIEF